VCFAYVLFQKESVVMVLYKTLKPSENLCRTERIIQNMSNQDERDKLEQDARIALLQHYSTKSSNQAIILVTLAIVFFGFIQTIGFLHNKVVASLYEWAVLTGLFLVGFRAIRMLLRYGRLSSIVQKVSLKSEQEIANSDKELLRKDFDESCWNKNPYTVTYFARLTSACDDYIKMAKVHAKPSRDRRYEQVNDLRWYIVGCFSILVLVTSIIINGII
jgi:hypothetical protein